MKRISKTRMEIQIRNYKGIRCKEIYLKEVVSDLTRWKASTISMMKKMIMEIQILEWMMMVMMMKTLIRRQALKIAE